MNSFQPFESYGNRQYCLTMFIQSCMEEYLQTNPAPNAAKQEEWLCEYVSDLLIACVGKNTAFVEILFNTVDLEYLLNVLSKLSPLT